MGAGLGGSDSVGSGYWLVVDRSNPSQSDTEAGDTICPQVTKRVVCFPTTSCQPHETIGESRMNSLLFGESSLPIPAAGDWIRHPETAPVDDEVAAVRDALAHPIGTK